MSESAVDNIEAGKPKQETEEEMELRHLKNGARAKRKRELREKRKKAKEEWENGHEEAAKTLLTLNGNGGHKKCIKF